MMAPEHAKLADEAIERAVRAAGLEVTARGVTPDEALAHHFRIIRENWIVAWMLIVERLRETGNDEMLQLADPEVWD